MPIQLGIQILRFVPESHPVFTSSCTEESPCSWVIQSPDIVITRLPAQEFLDKNRSIKLQGEFRSNRSLVQWLEAAPKAVDLGVHIILEFSLEDLGYGFGK